MWVVDGDIKLGVPELLPELALIGRDAGELVWRWIWLGWCIAAVQIFKSRFLALERFLRVLLGILSNTISAF